jgi:tetratricopeptide (TPR) repeat protein
LQTAVEFSFVRPHPRGYTFHEVTRGALRDRLLRKDRERFREISFKVAALFSPKLTAEDEDLAFERAYLMVGYDEKGGFEYFDSLYMNASQSRRYATCGTLLGMISEMEPLLSPEGVRRIHAYRALSALNLRDFDLAEKLFEELYLLDLPVEFAARVALGLGIALENKSRLQEAARVYEAGIAKLGNAEPTLDVTWRLHNRAALVLIRLGDVAKAEKHAERGLRLSRNAGHLTGQAMSLETIGQLYNKLRDLPKARQAFEESLGLFKKAGLEYEESRAFLSLAALEESVSKWDAAEKWYQTARKIKTALGDDHGVAIVDANLGNLCLRRDQPRASFDFFRSSLDTFRRFRDGLRASQVLYSMAIACERSNQIPEAVEHLESAIEEAPDWDPPKNQLLSELQRVRRLLESGRESH